MTPGELQLMRAMLREEIQPVRDELGALAARTTKLEEAKKTHSGEMRAVTKEVIPRMQSEAKLERKGDNEATGVAFDRMAAFMNDIAETVARIEDKQQPVTTVRLDDGRGRTSERPASLVAAESSVRTENAAYKIEGKADAIQVAANRSDTQSLAAKKWAKGSTITSIVFAVVLGIWQAYTAIAHSSP